LVQSVTKALEIGTAVEWARPSTENFRRGQQYLASRYLDNNAKAHYQRVVGQYPLLVVATDRAALDVANLVLAFGDADAPARDDKELGIELMARMLAADCRFSAEAAASDDPLLGLCLLPMSCTCRSSID